MTWKIHQLDASVPASQWLDRIRHRPWAFLLQSGETAGQRYDILGADPVITVETVDGRTRVADGDDMREVDDPFLTIARIIADRRPAAPCPLDIPFIGGAVGSFGYELAYRLERIGSPVKDTATLPELEVGIFEWFIVCDRQEATATLVATPHVTDLAFRKLKAELTTEAPRPGPFRSTTGIAASFTRATYDRAIERILGYIHAGDCYQVNLAQRFEAGFEGDPLGLYDAIAKRQNAPYGACLLTPRNQVMSFSPERFLRVDDNQVVTQPIKGTRPRGATDAEDSALAAELAASEKDRAENLMIVDLLRNDLGRCCRIGSVHVDRLFELKSFPNVHHLVSTVTGELRDDLSPMALLRSCFPGGSITGAPKIRAMQIIRELEPVRRGPYCGAIGYYSYSGNLDTNLPIRTLVCASGRVRYWGGGGIVADSTPDGEYDESLAKVDFIRAALERPRRSTSAAESTR
ncbi:MAG: aminodeoxychorismate synthase component I [Gammaproteobacteria bacterium]|nr:aminodeoxychorismate synthase component I [Gammaproteobacteria bacterium]